MSTLPQLPKRGEDILSWAKRIQRYVHSITPRTGATIKVNQTEGGTTFETRPRADTPYPFQVIPDSDYTPVATNARRVKIRGGRWDVVKSGKNVSSFTITSESPLTNGNGIFSSSGVSNPHLPSAEIPVEANESTEITDGQTVYLYLFLQSNRAAAVGGSNISRSGDCANADSLQATWSTTRPEEDIQAGGWNCISLKVLAVVENDGGQLTITQKWKGGDIKTNSLVPDSADVVYDGTNEDRYSLGFNRDGAMEIYGFEASSYGTVPYASAEIDNDKETTWDWMAKFEGSPTGSNGWLQDVTNRNSSGGAIGTSSLYRYIDFTDKGYEVGNRFDGSWDVGASGSTYTFDIWEYIAAYIRDGQHDHSDHTFTSDDHVTQGVDRYLINDGNAARNNMQSGSWIGDSSNANSISPDARELAGVWTATDTTPAALGGFGALLVPNGGINYGDGLVGAKGAASFAASFTDGSTDLNICDGTRGLITDGIIEIFGTGGDYWHNSQQGWTGTFQALQNGNTVDVTVSGGIIVNVS